MAFDNPGTEVSHRAGGIGLDGCLGILYHKQAVLVVGVGDGKGILAQTIEEGFLGIAVVLHGLVIVQMVACQVCEQASCKFQAADAFLCDGMAATLHKGIVATSIHHLCQQAVELDGVWSRMTGRDGLAFDIVTDRREQAALMAELTEHII